MLEWKVIFLVYDYIVNAVPNSDYIARDYAQARTYMGEVYLASLVLL